MVDNYFSPHGQYHWYSCHSGAWHLLLGGKSSTVLSLVICMCDWMLSLLSHLMDVISRTITSAVCQAASSFSGSSSTRTNFRTALDSFDSDFLSGKGSTSVQNRPKGVKYPKLSLYFFRCHSESGSLRCRISITKLSLLIPLISRIMVLSAWVIPVETLLVEMTNGVPALLAAGAIEAVVDATLALTPLTSLLIVLEEPERLLREISL